MAFLGSDCTYHSIEIGNVFTLYLQAGILDLGFPLWIVESYFLGDITQPLGYNFSGSYSSEPKHPLLLAFSGIC